MGRKRKEDCGIRFKEDGRIFITSPGVTHVVEEELTVRELLQHIGMKSQNGDGYFICVERVMEPVDGKST